MPNPYTRIARLRSAEDFRAYTEKLNIHLPFDETVAVGPDAPLAGKLRLQNGKVIGNRFCILPMEGWDKPRCVQACPTGALEFLLIEDIEMQKMIESDNVDTLHPEYGLEPRVYYKNLYRFTKCFVTGSVALKGVDECAEGAKVLLKNGSGKVIDTTVTNIFGDFKIDNLEENSGKYSLEVEYPGFQKHELSVALEDSIDVGTIYL